MERHPAAILPQRIGLATLALAVAGSLAMRDLRAQQGNGFDLSWNRPGSGTVGIACGGGFELQGAPGQTTVGWRHGPAELALVEGYGAIYAVHSIGLRLCRGWNLVSIPLHPLDPAWTEVFPDAVPGPLWRWTEAGYEPVLTATPGCGYWVWSAAKAEWTILGIAVENPHRDLPAGWSLVGPVGLPPYPALGLPLETTPANAVVGPPWEWDARLGRCRPCSDGLPMGTAVWLDLAVPARLRLGP